MNPTVSSDLGRAVLRYSCPLAVADPAHLLVELIPARTAKRFEVDKHSEWTGDGRVIRCKRDREVEGVDITCRRHTVTLQGAVQIDTQRWV